MMGLMLKTEITRTMLDLTTLLCSLGVLLLSIAWMITRKGSKDQIPHYPGWPLVGNLLQIGNRPEIIYAEWAKELGPVISTKLLNKKFVVLNSFESIYEVLVEKGNAFAARPDDSYRLGVFTEKLTLSFCQPDSAWKCLRKTCHKKIKMYGTGMDRINQIRADMTKGLVQEFKSRKGSFNPKEIIFNTVTNMMMTLLLGKQYSTDSDLFRKIVECEKYFIRIISPTGKGFALDAFPWMRFFQPKIYRELMESLTLRNEIWELLKRETRLGDAELGGDEEDVRLVSALQHEAADESSELTERRIRVVSVSDMALAGMATTSNSMYMFLNILSNCPELQAKLQEEADRVVGSE